MSSTNVVVGVLSAGFCLFAAPALAPAAIMLSVPTFTEPTPSSPTIYTADVKFSTGGTTAPLVGYDIAFKVTGPNSNVTIASVSMGAGRPANTVFADDPTFFTNTSTGTTLYGVSDFLISGTGTITDGSTLVELKLQAAAGTIGTYHVDFDTDASSALNSLLYSDANLDPVPGLSLTNGSVTFASAPEPASLGLMGFGGLAMCRRRRR